MSAPSAAFWRGKRVLVTGHSGFKGSWLALWLHRLGANVTGISLPPLTEPNLFESANIAALCSNHFADIRDGAALAELAAAARPDVVFHLAAQPLVRAGYRAPRETFETNLMGTVHVLEALRGLDSVRAAVMVTTDKVYRDAPARPYREDDALGGHDPYSASKAACEIAIASYRDAFLSAQGVAVASARSGNVIGGGDWSADRLIPDAVRAWSADETLEIRRPDAVRPWQHVLEPLAGYLVLAQALCERPAIAGSYNFGPDANAAASVREVVELARRANGAGAVRYGDGGEGPHETAHLTLDANKSRDTLGVMPRLTLAQAIERAMGWYRLHAAGRSARELCETDIAAFAPAEAVDAAARRRA